MSKYKLNFIINLMFWIIVGLILNIPENLDGVKLVLLFFFIPYYLIRATYVDHFTDLELQNKAKEQVIVNFEGVKENNVS